MNCRMCLRGSAEFWLLIDPSESTRRRTNKLVKRGLSHPVLEYLDPHLSPPIRLQETVSQQKRSENPKSFLVWASDLVQPRRDLLVSSMNHLHLQRRPLPPPRRVRRVWA